jgi:hypothetical protein
LFECLDEFWFNVGVNVNDKHGTDTPD